MDKRIKIIGRKAKEPVFTASCLFTTAVHYYETAALVQTNCPDVKGAPSLKWFKARYLLIGHAIETALKSFLFFNGRSMNNLKKKGHDLCKTLRDAKSKGFNILGVGEEKIIIDLNEHYFRKDFEYEEVDFSKLPRPLDLLALTQKILGEVKRNLLKK